MSAPGFAVSSSSFAATAAELAERWHVRAAKARAALVHGFKALEVAVNEETTMLLPLGAHRSFWAGLSRDRVLLEFLAHNLPDDGLFLDVGAKVGVYTAALWKMRGRLRAAAFEPIPTTQALLQRTFDLNGVPATVETVALSDVARQLKLSRYENGLNNFWIVHDDGRHPTIDVEAVSLDSWCGGRAERRPGAVKIDVEGHELAVIKGARETFRAHRPALVVECHAAAWPELGVAAAEVDDELRSLGYRRLCDRQGRPVDIRAARDTFHLLALP